MTLPRNALATAVIAIGCMTGLTACGGSDSPKVADSEFISMCQDTTDKNPQLKAYGTEICKCVQDQLKAKGLGDKEESSDEVQSAETAAIQACGLKVESDQ
jgi:hypothetical protein